MDKIRQLKEWYRWGYWFDTPQGVCVLMSVPVCWVAAAISGLWSGGAKPLFLSSPPILFILTPLLAFLYFVRFGLSQGKPFSSSVYTTIMILAIVGAPFYVPYFRA
jgi:phosphoglycerol transferase MdoB-like AlkP superfamily enzyme